LRKVRLMRGAADVEHVPESSIEILGHSVGGITYRHYANRARLAFKAIMTLPPAVGVLIPHQGLRWRVFFLWSALRRRTGAKVDVIAPRSLGREDEM
jgi:alpha-beta hydrolase superfamily lysophospholipase